LSPAVARLPSEALSSNPRTAKKKKKKGKKENLVLGWTLQGTRWRHFREAEKGREDFLCKMSLETKVQNWRACLCVCVGGRRLILKKLIRKVITSFKTELTELYEKDLVRIGSGFSKIKVKHQ
jgi:hypothetical protein